MWINFWVLILSHSSVHQFLGQYWFNFHNFVVCFEIRYCCAFSIIFCSKLFWIFWAFYDTAWILCLFLLFCKKTKQNTAGALTGNEPSLQTPLPKCGLSVVLVAEAHQCMDKTIFHSFVPLVTWLTFFIVEMFCFSIKSIPKYLIWRVMLLMIFFYYSCFSIIILMCRNTALWRLVLSAVTTGPSVLTAVLVFPVYEVISAASTGILTSSFPILMLLFIFLSVLFCCF